MDFDDSTEQLNADLREHNIFSSPVLASNSESDVLFPGYKEELSTKRAVELLIAGTLKTKVCRYCLNIVSSLSELDQILQVAGTGALYKVTIRDMVASFYPFKVESDPNFPNKICNKCLNRTISAYLFTQQCERSERALRNCFDDMYDKLEKLDPLERPKKRGRQKRNPNYNTLYVDHAWVIDYADPIINLVNVKSVSLSKEPAMSDLECPKCWQLFTSIEELMLHEKTHPSSMWYNCRLCGTSFVKRLQLKRHLKQTHIRPEKPLETQDEKNFECKTCDLTTDDYSSHLQHMEKHKFQMVLEHLVEKDMDKLCAVCLDKDPKLVDLDKMVRLHGGYPGVSGDKTLYSILGSTLPDMNSIHNYTGTKICEKCLNNAITAYVFINHSIYTRDRLNTCVTSMLDSLNKIDEPEGNIFIEIAKESILPIKEDLEDYYDENLLLEEDEVDETKLKVDVLEDEFRKPDSEEETNSEPEIKDYINTFLKEDNESKDFVKDSDEIDIFDEFSVKRDYYSEIENPAKRVTKTYANRRLVNGYQAKYPSDNEGYNSLDDVSEFLTFKKKKKPIKKYYKYKFCCPLCYKAFVTDFHLRRHILKHVPKKMECTTCKAVFKSKFFLYEHIKMVHILDKLLYFACKVCGRSFDSEEKVKSHENYHFHTQCQLCDKIFVTQKHLESHLQRHAVKLNRTKHSSQICSFCEKDYTNDNKLSVHVNKVHLQIKPYSCDMCERQFYTEHNLSQHKKIHNLKKNESCELCKKRFNTRKGMVIHLRKHTGETPHRCPLCGKAFYSETKAKSHMKNYHGGTLYCKLCKCVFSCKYDLKTHVIMVHNHNAML